MSVPHTAPREDPLGEVREAIRVTQDRGDIGPLKPESTRAALKPREKMVSGG